MAFYDDPSGLTRYDSSVFYDGFAAPVSFKRMKINLSLSRKTILQTIDLAKTVKNKLTGNVILPDPNPGLVAFGTLITEAEAANLDYESALATADEKLVIRDQKMDALRAGITTQASYVEDTATTAAEVESAGFNPQKAPTPATPPAQVENLSVTSGDTDGRLDLQWDPDPNAAKGYEIQTSPDPVTASSFVHRDIVSESKAQLNELTSGTRIWVRVRALGTKSQKGPWSNPVSKIVP